MRLRQCTEPGCNRPHNARGYCKMHYARFRRSGQISCGRLAERRARDRVECRSDLELLGLTFTAKEAARRCGVDQPVALAVLVPLHAKHGHSLKLSALILGVSARTVVRYRLAARGVYRVAA